MPRTPPPSSIGLDPDQIEAELYAAMRHGDVDRLMALWADEDEIVCVHPGGQRLVGASAIRAAFETLFANGAIDVEPQQVRRLDSHASAVHSVVERIRVKTADGERFAWVVATNVYLQSALGWRLVAHHASPGTSGEPEVRSEASQTLH